MNPAIVKLLTHHAAGIFPDEPAETYLAGPGISFGKLLALAESPRHFLCALTEPPPEVEPDYFIVGRLAHQYILEKKCDLPPEIALKPEGMSFASKEGKLWQAQAEAAGKTIIKESDWRGIAGMAEAVQQSAVASRFFGKGQAEVSVYNTIDCMGTPLCCRIRADFLPHDGTAMPDLKTSGQLLTDRHIQDVLFGDSQLIVRAAWYSDLLATAGVTAARYYPVFVEKAPPHGVKVVYITDEQLEFGRQIYLGLLQRLGECLKADRWPGYPDAIYEVEKPAWVKIPRWRREQLEEAP